MSVADFPAVGEVKQALPGTEAVPVVPVDVVLGTQNGSSASNANDNSMYMTEVDDGKFLLKGAASRGYIDSLKKLGGFWNRGIKAWSFDAKSQQDVIKFLHEVAAGNITPEPTTGGGFVQNRRPYQNKQNFHHNEAPAFAVKTDLQLPEYRPASSSYHQLGPWKAFVPTVGMFAEIKVGNNSNKCRVLQVHGNDQVGYWAVIDAGGKQSKLETGNGGHWQVRGYVPPHTIFFSN